MWICYITLHSCYAMSSPSGQRCQICVQYLDTGLKLSSPSGQRCQICVQCLDRGLIVKWVSQIWVPHLNSGLMVEFTMNLGVHFLNWDQVWVQWISKFSEHLNLGQNLSSVWTQISTLGVLLELGSQICTVFELRSQDWVYYLNSSLKFEYSVWIQVSRLGLLLERRSRIWVYTVSELRSPQVSNLGIIQCLNSGLLRSQIWV